MQASTGTIFFPMSAPVRVFNGHLQSNTLGRKSNVTLVDT